MGLSTKFQSFLTLFLVTYLSSSWKPAAGSDQRNTQTNHDSDGGQWLDQFATNELNGADAISVEFFDKLTQQDSPILNQLKTASRMQYKNSTHLLSSIKNPVAVVENGHVRWIGPTDVIVIKPKDKVIVIDVGSPKQMNRVEEIIEQLRNAVDGSILIVTTDSSQTANHIKRSKRSSESLEQPGFVNFTDCIFMYTLGGCYNRTTFELANNKITEWGKEIPMPKPGLSVSGFCRHKEESGLEKAQLVLNYQNDVTVTFNITTWPHKGWEISNVTLEMVDQKPIHFKYNESWAGVDFSWSCSQWTLVNWEDNKTHLVTHRLILRRFQMQPFVAQRQSAVFAASFDCSTFMTIGLWMGLLVVIMMFAIVFIGVVLLSNIHTQDRFENPKGKTITITATE